MLEEFDTLDAVMGESSVGVGVLIWREHVVGCVGQGCVVVNGVRYSLLYVVSEVLALVNVFSGHQLLIHAPQNRVLTLLPFQIP